MNLWNRLSETVKRIIKFCFATLCIFFSGMIYYVLADYGLGMSCMLYKFFNIQCGTCGITRMCSALIEFRFKDAFNYNQLYFILLPVIVYLYIKIGINYVKSGEVKLSDFDENIVYLILMATGVFAVVRNII